MKNLNHYTAKVVAMVLAALVVTGCAATPTAEPTAPIATPMSQRAIDAWAGRLTAQADAWNTVQERIAAEKVEAERVAAEAAAKAEAERLAAEAAAQAEAERVAAEAERATKAEAERGAAPKAPVAKDTSREPAPAAVQPARKEEAAAAKPDQKVERKQQVEAEARRLGVEPVWQDMAVRGKFRPATPNVVYLNPSILDDADIAWSYETVRHEAAHSAIKSLCGRADPSITAGRVEETTDAYAHLFLGGLTRPRYGHTAADDDVARSIHAGACAAPEAGA